MHYLLMCGFDETRWAQLPDAQRGQIMQEYRAFMRDIVTSGHVRAGETKEQLGGYRLVECQDRDETLVPAGSIPTLRVSSVVEVRPVVPASEQ
jgi:hypothetical protein